MRRFPTNNINEQMEEVADYVNRWHERMPFHVDHVEPEGDGYQVIWSIGSQYTYRLHLTKKQTKFYIEKGGMWADTWYYCDIVVDWIRMQLYE